MPGPQPTALPVNFAMMKELVETGASAFANRQIMMDATIERSVFSGTEVQLPANVRGLYGQHKSTYTRNKWLELSRALQAGPAQFLASQQHLVMQIARDKEAARAVWQNARAENDSLIRAYDKAHSIARIVQQASIVTLLILGPMAIGGAAAAGAARVTTGWATAAAEQAAAQTTLAVVRQQVARAVTSRVAAVVAAPLVQTGIRTGAGMAGGMAIGAGVRVVEQPLEATAADIIAVLYQPDERADLVATLGSVPVQRAVGTQLASRADLARGGGGARAGRLGSVLVGLYYCSPRLEQIADDLRNVTDTR
ncbi:MAG: hypothetical protein AAF318_14790 [Pseudomonadota bacterium]